jgi:murE/murF fusion protein
LNLQHLVDILGSSVREVSVSRSECASLPVIGLYTHARRVEPGGLFVAIPGFSADGHDFIDEAVNNGASTVLAQRPVNCSVPVVVVENGRKALSRVAAEWYGHPSRILHLTGITGTNGKTTVSYLLESMLQAAGKNVGVIGTVNYRYGGRTWPNPVTTPDALDLQRLLHRMLADGVTHVVMEVSSHAIDLHRVADCSFNTAVFTNLTQDHLDYHGDMERYWQCKRRWFTDSLRSQPADAPVTTVINHDNAHGRELAAGLSGSGMSEIVVASTPPPDETATSVIAQNTAVDLSGIRGNLLIEGEATGFASPLVGPYNLENILCAAGAALAAGVSPASICAGIGRCDCIPGRLEQVPDAAAGRHIYVDYAHTPDALENVLATLSSLATGRIIAVFGCGGDRDRAKRPLMGEIAGRYADLAVITSDNPRSESPQAIIEQIEAGIRVVTTNRCSVEDAISGTVSRGYVVESDRKAAIALAVRAARANDILLIAGKGHETYQILAQGTVSFDDREVVRNCLAADTVPGRAAAAVREPSWQWQATDMLAATGGILLSGSREQRFRSVFTDSRQEVQNGLFLALKGEHHDGHRFAGELVTAGTRGVIVNLASIPSLPLDEWKAAGAVCIGVNDSLQALGRLARFNRRRAALPVAAITGSNGKTTTKEMTAAVVRQGYRTLASKGNFNNEIGLPLTLLDLSPHHTAAVLELGMNHAGEMDRLGAICEPDLVVITNVGPVHLEGLGSIQGVMHAKGELLAHLRYGGTAVLNGDDPHVRPLAATTCNTVLLFGTDARADVRAEKIRTVRGGLALVIRTPLGTFEATLAAPGRFMAYNALAATAVGHLLGLSNREIAAGLERFRMPPGRLNISIAPRGFTLIDDTYNANPVSMKAAIATLTDLKADHRAILVAGDMFELGGDAAHLHRDVGHAAGRAGLFHLFATGENAPHVAAGAREAGMPAQAVTVGNVDDISTRLETMLRRNDWVLVKGSRGMRMERVVHRIKEL